VDLLAAFQHGDELHDALGAWIARGAISVVSTAGNKRSELAADPFIDLAVEMRVLCDEGQQRAPIATALRRLEERRASR